MSPDVALHSAWRLVELASSPGRQPPCSRVAAAGPLALPWCLPPPQPPPQPPRFAVSEHPQAAIQGSIVRAADAAGDAPCRDSPPAMPPPAEAQQGVWPHIKRAASGIFPHDERGSELRAAHSNLHAAVAADATADATPKAQSLSHLPHCRHHRHLCSGALVGTALPAGSPAE